MARPRAKRKRRSKAMKVIYTIMGVSALSYFPAHYLPRSGGPQISMVLLSLLVIPFGSRSKTVSRGLLTGLGIGLWGGITTACVLAEHRVLSPSAVAMSVLGAGFLCAALCGSFIYPAMGLCGGLTAACTLVQQRAILPGALAVSILGTAFLCAAVCGLFAHVAGKRAASIDQQWNR